MSSPSSFPVCLLTFFPGFSSGLLPSPVLLRFFRPLRLSSSVLFWKSPPPPQFLGISFICVFPQCFSLFFVRPSLSLLVFLSLSSVFPWSVPLVPLFFYLLRSPLVRGLSLAFTRPENAMRW